MKFVILALALVGLVFGHPHHCFIQTDKQFFDLSNIEQLDFSFADDNAELTTTYFNLCGPVASVPDCAQKNVAVCVQSPAKTVVSKGYESMKSLNYDNDTLVMTYSGDLCDGNTQYVTDFVMLCNQKTEIIEVDDLTNVDKCHRVITVSSRAFCPAVPHRKSKILVPFIAITALAACCCACLCCACRRRFRRSRCNQQQQQQGQSACQKKCFFQRICQRSCANKGYQPVSTQTEINAVPMDSMNQTAYPPVFMYPPMFNPMLNGQVPFAPIPMDAKTFQEQSDEALARQLQEQINHETA